MKRCPYCAEWIQDEAVKCRYCQSDLTAAERPTNVQATPSTAPSNAPATSDAATSPAQSRSGAGALRFSHSGFRYVLGFGEDFFGIWSREQPAQPVQRFPRTDQGWAEAWNGIHALEPQAVEVPAAAESADAPRVAVQEPTEAPAGMQQTAPAADPSSAQAAETAPTGQRIGEGALRFSHSGTRYILGFGQDFFGIWDRETPGGPIMRFPRTDEGWSAAWNRFTAWEPKAIEVPQTGTPAPDARGPSGSYRSGRALAGGTVILISVTMILGLVSAGLWAGRLGTISSFRQGTATLQDLDNSREAALGVDGFMAFIVFITAILWLLWQFRAHSNLRTLGVAQLKYSPGWAVAWWFIPVANIVMPYLTVRELYKASDPQAGSIDWAMRGGGGVVAAWWTARLVTQALFQIGVVFGDRSDLSAMRLEAGFFVAGNLVFVALGVLAILVVRAIDTRQTQKHERMATWTRSFGQAG